jgi:transcriptional regulator with XRE-family HTH domain
VTEDEIDRFYLELGRRVREARTDAGVTQAHLAEEIQMTRSSVANLEAGRQRVPLHLLFAIADMLSVEPASILPAREPQTHLSLEGLDERSRRPLSAKDRSFLQTALRAAVNRSIVNEPS